MEKYFPSAVQRQPSDILGHTCMRCYGHTVRLKTFQSWDHDPLSDLKANIKPVA